MAARLAWWTIPAMFVVLVRVVTLPQSPAGEPDLPAPAVPSSVGEPFGEPFGEVVLRDATGARSGPLDLTTLRALVLRLPTFTCGQRIELCLRRYVPHAEAPELWLSGNPRVRADGTVPIAGLPEGRYSVEVAWGDGSERCALTRDEVLVPGTIDFAAAR